MPLIVVIAVRTYSFAIRLLLFLGHPYFSSSRKKRKYRTRQRFGLPPVRKSPSGAAVVWVHAASMGEAKILLDFVQILKSKHPSHRYVVTAQTETGVNRLVTSGEETLVAAGYFPFDTIGLMEKMLAKFSISRVWLMETEIWPSLLYVCKKQGVPVGVMNARMEEKSFSAYNRFRALLSPLLAHVNPVLAQDQTYADRFVKMGVRPDAVSVMGNLKSRIAIKRPHGDVWSGLRKKLSIGESNTVVTAGCMHGGEAEDLRAAIQRIASEDKGFKWIVVPRHMEDIPQILEVLGPKTVHLQDIKTAANWDVCVIEKYGVLEDLYSIADAAVVGGTFVDIGGHNVWEPAQFGVPVIWGPHSYKQRESCDRLSDAGVGFSVRSGDELGEKLLSVLKRDARQFIKSELAFMEEMKSSLSDLEEVIP